MKSDNKKTFIITIKMNKKDLSLEREAIMHVSVYNSLKQGI